MAGFGLVLPKKKVGYTFIGGKHVMNYVITDTFGIFLGPKK